MKMWRFLTRCGFFPLLLAFSAPAQEPAAAERGSIIEDRAARKLLQAGDARLELGENEKALEVWASVVERYPQSQLRFEAHLRLADHLLKETRDYAKARVHFEAAAVESNQDDERRAYAYLQTGVCFYEAGNYGKCFTIMRDVIERFPASTQVNEAFFHIGMGHFKLGHYSRAIEALEKVGTVLSGEDSKIEKLEAGKRLYIKIDDLDLAILPVGAQIKVHCVTRSGDEETLLCDPVGRNARVVLGALVTTLGSPNPNNGVLELRGGDTVTVTYADTHTAGNAPDQKRTKEVVVVGNGLVRITDGSYQEDSQAAVLGKPLNLQIADADQDTSDKAETLKADLQVFRRKTGDEIDDELATRVAAGELAEGPEGELLKDQIEPLLRIRSMPVILKETSQSGVFRAAVPVLPGTAKNTLTGASGEIIRLVYLDERHLGEGPVVRTAEVKIIEGNLGEVRVTRTDISDQELRLKTEVRTATALTEVGNQYKEFGLNDKADLKYAEALAVCESTLEQARATGGQLLEETYVQLWRIYFAMDKLDLTLGMSQRLLAEFPASTFVDEAMLQQAHVQRKRANYPRAISLYATITKLPDSRLRGESQFLIGECYEAMALQAAATAAVPLFEQAFLAYQAVYEQFPDSGRIGDAVAKMAAFYYQKEDYRRAIDVFDNVLSDHPDANFLDVILFNYGRCLYKVDRKPEARKRFEQLINDYPESPIAAEANKIVEALSKAGF
jgi:tetratricopeptide (TPR) repeat protein